MDSFLTVKEVDSCKYLCLDSISEPEANTLRLVLSEGVASNRMETLEIGGAELSGVRPIEVTAASRRFELIWNSYISYAVRNESYCTQDKNEQWLGNTFRTYAKSMFLDFVMRSTSANSGHPGPFTHYEVLCSDHIIDVASEHPPTVRKLD